MISRNLPAVLMSAPYCPFKHLSVVTIKLLEESHFKSHMLQLPLFPTEKPLWLCALGGLRATQHTIEKSFVWKEIGETRITLGQGCAV